MRQVVMHEAATAPALGEICETLDIVHHSYQVTVTGTGAVSVTVEPRHSNDDAGAGAGNLWSTAQTVSGTGTASQTFTAEGAAGYASCPITAVSGVDATVRVVYVGA